MERSRYLLDLQGNQDKLASTASLSSGESSLFTISRNFPRIGGFSFLETLNLLNRQGNLCVMEYGGGSQQQAAREILKNQNNLSHYYAYEALSSESSTSIQGLKTEFQGRYVFMNGGLVDFEPEAFYENGINLAFAHNVAVNLADPFLLVQKMHKSLRMGGHLFINNILLDREEANKLVSQWRKQGIEFDWTLTENLGKQLAKGNFVGLNIAIIKTTDEIMTPIPIDEPIIDANGRKYNTLVCLTFTEEQLSAWEKLKKEYVQGDFRDDAVVADDGPSIAGNIIYGSIKTWEQRKKYIQGVFEGDDYADDDSLTVREIIFGSNYQSWKKLRRRYFTRGIPDSFGPDLEKSKQVIDNISYSLRLEELRNKYRDGHFEDDGGATNL